MILIRHPTGAKDEIIPQLIKGRIMIYVDIYTYIMIYYKYNYRAEEFDLVILPTLTSWEGVPVPLLGMPFL